jgi:hypothetical protein
MMLSAYALGGRERFHPEGGKMGGARVGMPIGMYSTRGVLAAEMMNGM